MELNEYFASKGFPATRSFMSVRGDFVVAIDGAGRVVLAQVFTREMFSFKVARLAEITVEARENGRPLDETQPAMRGPAAGVLVLRIRYEERNYDISFSQRVSQDGGATEDWEHYEAMRQQLAWWRDTLLGKTAREPVRVERAELPEARVVKRDR